MAQEKEFFLENLSLLMRSAMPVQEALQSLKTEVRTPRMKDSIGVIEAELDAGASLSKAFQKARIMPERFLTLVRIGEDSGGLARQIAVIVAQEKKERAFRSKVRSALIYPAFVVVATIIAGLLTIWYTFPKLIAIFEFSGGQLPLSTRVIIAIGSFFKSYGIVAVPLFAVALCATVYYLFLNPKTKVVGERILMRLPVARSIIQQIELARFGYGMGTLLSAGVSLPQTLSSAGDSTSFVLYKRLYARMLERVMNGNSLYRSMQDDAVAARLIPPHIIQLLAAGERSGSMPDTFITIGSSYEQKTEELTANVAALIEPVIIVLVGLAVAALAAGILAPIYGLVGQIN